MVKRDMANHRFNYEWLMVVGDIKVTRQEMKVLIKKLLLDGIDHHIEDINDNCYHIEVY